MIGRHYDTPVNEDALTLRLYADPKTSLVDEILTKVDRMTMAHGLTTCPSTCGRPRGTALPVDRQFA